MFIPVNFLKKEFPDSTDVNWADSEENDVLLLMEKVIAVYLERYFEKLLNIMYRMDIDEKDFSAALLDKNPSHTIAILVIEREKRRLMLRENYKNKGNN